MSDQQGYLAKVVQVHGSSGPGGGIKHVTLELLNQKRTLSRAVTGPIKVGHIITIMDCEREYKRGK
ncbi:40S ribosomal protein S28 [Pseudoloma neurophilia]|uniref:40S ribosomal protein S28 n=1 Tax=Pseudoloma neurophilia TaxID=146866 RepID=A0A0R0LXJ3_9MICR|nr:40S ribosomal protein S28 [Pseudoloma neurophilia]